MKIVLAMLGAVITFLAMVTLLNISFAYIEIVTDTTHLSHYNAIPELIVSYYCASKVYSAIK